MNDFKESKLKEKEQLFKQFEKFNPHRKKIRYVVKGHTDWVDSSLKSLVQYLGISKDGIAFVAVGGYGRRQLNPYSDIDILLLADKPKRSIGGVVRDILDFFYYLKYECSVSVRTPDECVEFASDDDTIRTSLIDSRFLFGDKSVWNSFLDVLNEKIIGENKNEFIEAKLRYMESRYKKFGGTVFVLEPNVKEGVGSLRDYHTLLWIGKVLYGTKNVLQLKKMGFMEDEDYRKLIESVHFLWQLRNALHFEAKKKNDTLMLNIRDRIADMLNFSSSGRFSKSERLMRRCYYNTRNIKNIVNRYLDIYLKKTEGHIFFLDDRFQVNSTLKLNDNPSLNDIFEAFFYSAQYNKPIDPEDLGKIRKVLTEIYKSRKSRALSFIFRQILSLNNKVFKVLESMHEVGILGRYIPEFGNVCCLTEDSLYHKYTVDEHSLQSIKVLDELYDYDVPKTFLMRLKHIWVHLKPHERYVLRLACLLHDIGKVQKENHEIVGAELAKKIADRLYLGKDLKEMLEFLVRYHLFLNSIISTRDIDDQKTLDDFLNVVDNKDKLNLLVLLTYADMKAVNDNVWTSWKEDLVEAIYLKATFNFENKDYDEYMRLHAVDSKRKVKAILGNDYFDLIDKLPDAVFNDIKFDIMAQYIRDIKDTGRNAFVYKQDESQIAKVVIYYDNEFGFFNRISGVLACLGANIITAKSYNLLDGKILDLFTVSLDKDFPVDDFTVEDMIFKVENNEFNLDECMESKRRRFLNRLERAKLEISLRNVDVVVDNDLSELYTVIRVFAPDRVGLVYYITKVFVEFKLQIGMFLLDTKGSVAIDTFYVVDENFRKIYSSKLIELIKSRLYEVLI